MMLYYFFLSSLVCAVIGLRINAGFHDYSSVGTSDFSITRPEIKKSKVEKQDFSKIPGVPGHDYPIYHSVPKTSFSCQNVPALPGMYANVETGCQAYHVCHDGREGDQGSAFLCTNGTLFNQKEFACDWWYNVDCRAASTFYGLNMDSKKNPYFQKQAEEEERDSRQI